MMPFDALDLPVIAAPMAGGPSTVNLVRDVSRAGGWGLLAAANKTVAAMAEEIDQLRADRIPVGVNLFVPDTRSEDADALAQLRHRLEPVAERFTVELGTPEWDDDSYATKTQWLLDHPVDVVTFTMGLPERDLVAALHQAGSIVGITVTSADDAVAAAAVGADFLTVQGPEAGGHQSTFAVSAEPNNIPLLGLLTAVRECVDLPLVASGGLATPADVRVALADGAVAAQVGTAFLRSSSAGSSATHRAALASPDFTATTLTRAFSGRFARGLENDYSRRFSDDAVAAYPEVNRLSGPLRKAAAAAGDPQWTHLWAGIGWRRTAEAAPAGLLDGEAGAIARWLAGA